MKELLFILLLGFEIFCLTCFLFSLLRPGSRLWPPTEQNTSRNYVLLFFFYVFLIGVVWLSVLESGETLFDIAGLGVLGKVMLVAGLCLYFWCRVYLSKKQEFGFAGVLATAGPYRYVRNPMYLADILIFMGFGFLCNSPYLFTIVGIFSAIMVLLPFIEEPWLKQQYGVEYVNYCARVPRFVPRIRYE
jgi:protein-S-isoprenylcysteine O-methyltransferase Ste14